MLQKGWELDLQSEKSSKIGSDIHKLQQFSSVCNFIFSFNAQLSNFEASIATSWKLKRFKF